ncbi:MAG: YpsA SLOG family protein [Chthoniobacterales bacterium]
MGKGTIDQRYQLKETSTKNYPQRTEKNVRNSDGTAIFTILPNITGGSKKTAELPAKHDNRGLICIAEVTRSRSGSCVRFRS